jgi:anti-sigma B factor antagonist
MKITATEQGEVMIVALDGSLDATTADQASEHILQWLGQASEQGQPTVNLVLDLSGVEFMSSAGLRAILASTQEARNAGGDVRLASGSKNIKRVLDFSGFTKIMKYFETVAEAVQSFAG